MKVLSALAGAALVALSALPVLPARAAELIMVDQVGCYWCERWEAEIGPVYPKTPEAAFAPLRHINIRDVADEITLDRRVMFTPTFLLVEDGSELARIEGYPGEDFFWPLIDKILRENTTYTGGDS